MEPWKELSTTFDRGLNNGVESLSPEDRELFFIQRFILEYEMGDWLHNIVGDWLNFDETINAMQNRGLSELADILSEVKVLFQTYDHMEFQPGFPPMTWSEVKKICDPNNKLKTSTVESTAWTTMVFLVSGRLEHNHLSNRVWIAHQVTQLSAIGATRECLRAARRVQPKRCAHVEFFS